MDSPFDDEYLAAKAEREHELDEARSEIGRHHDLIRDMRSLLDEWRETFCGDPWEDAAYSDVRQKTNEFLNRQVG